MVSIACDTNDSSICRTGQVVAGDKVDLMLHEISPNGDWNEDVTLVFVEDISRIEFATERLETLLLVADYRDN